MGQVWKWADHAGIFERAKRLVGWVAANQMQRGWLHTMLELVEARHGPKQDALATARLTYHVNRNYKPHSESRGWAEDIVSRFDDPNDSTVRYLQAVIRDALSATRTAEDRE